MRMVYDDGFIQPTRIIPGYRDSRGECINIINAATDYVYIYIAVSDH